MTVVFGKPGGEQNLPPGVQSMLGGGPSHWNTISNAAGQAGNAAGLLGMDIQLVFVNCSEDPEKSEIVIFAHFTATYNTEERILKFDNYSFGPEATISLDAPILGLSEKINLEVVTGGPLELKVDGPLHNALEAAKGSGQQVKITIYTPDGYTSPPMVLQWD